ncbi:MAG: gamma-glutamyltransferase [Tenericutes bacterium HGW-Tenericutes-1]|nr:MAG: gamma-glutamyltransferase [Tenericutes bacterium HGW-Tenericutes-1]
MNKTNPNYPYASKRSVLYAKNGMVATSQPLAAMAGLEILKKGGNAIDSAIATAACLTVVEPTSNGIGGDAFALVWFQDKLHGLNSSGYAPQLMSIDALQSRGFNSIPKYGLLPVTVPGIPAAWAALNQKFGKLSLIECLRPAIAYAKEGYPVSEHVAKHWQNAYDIYKKHLSGEEFNEWFETFTFNSKAPNTGDIVKLPHHAKTLELIGVSNSKAFYEGELAELIDAYSIKYNGFIRKSDLISYQPLWVDPISVNYKGYDICEIPPNGQGMVALQALNIMNGFNFSVKENEETYHTQIEAMKLAFSDGLSQIADIFHMNKSIVQFLSSDYATLRRKEISNICKEPLPYDFQDAGTVYLCTADKEGNMVSFIQSNYMGFGSGIVIPNTGIALHNRGLNFSLELNHPNLLKPLKRPYHTIIPGFIMKDKQAIGPFGVMGGFMQPQGHLQVIMNLIDFNMNPQAAIDAPRWQWMEGKKVMVEPTVDKSIIEALIKRGHDIHIEHELSHFGRGQIILKDLKSGVYAGASEPRCDGHIALY